MIRLSERNFAAVVKAARAADPIAVSDGGAQRVASIADPDDDRSAPAKPFGTYPGSKDAAGVAERIIAELPPHSVYVEAFLGGGAVLRRKVPALSSIAIDSDEDVVKRWRAVAWPGVDIIGADAIRWLSKHGGRLPPDALVYADPPYMPGTRGHRRIYRCELTESDHVRLLAALDRLPCSVAISGYASSLYDTMLAGWRHVEFPAMTRGGPRTEHLWVRSTIAGFGGDTRLVGANFRERERIKRKRQRWAAKFRAMPDAERRAVLASLLAAERAATPLFRDLESSEVTMDATRRRARA